MVTRPKRGGFLQPNLLVIFRIHLLISVQLPIMDAFLPKAARLEQVVMQDGAKLMPHIVQRGIKPRPSSALYADFLESNGQLCGSTYLITTF